MGDNLQAFIELVQFPHQKQNIIQFMFKDNVVKGCKSTPALRCLAPYEKKEEKKSDVINKAYQVLFGRMAAGRRLTVAHC